MKRALAVVAALVMVAGCAGRGVVAFEGRRAALLAGLDDFNLLLLGSGIEPQELPVAEVTATEAQRLLAELKLKSPTITTYAPRRVAEVLLMEVLTMGESVTREELNRRLQRYQKLAVLTPEGFMSWALTGEVAEWVGKVEVVSGMGKAHSYTVGYLYGRAGGAGWRQEEWTEGWAERMGVLAEATSR